MIETTTDIAVCENAGRCGDIGTACVWCELTAHASALAAEVMENSAVPDIVSRAESLACSLRDCGEAYQGDDSPHDDRRFERLKLAELLLLVVGQRLRVEFTGQCDCPECTKAEQAH